MRTCDYCGRENNDEAVTCTGCAGELQPEAVVIKQTKAGFWIRATARVIDDLFCFLFSISTGAFMGAVLVLLIRLHLVPADWQSRIQLNSLLAIFSFTLANVFYHSICEGVHGATLGKLCCGLCVVSADGKPSNMKGAFIRSFAFLFPDSLFLGAAGYSAMKKSPLNQRYGDMWGGTAVIKTNEMLPGSERTTGRLLIALALGIMAYIILVAVGILFKIWEN